MIKEFEDAFQLLEETNLPVCFVRGIPHYDEGYEARVAGHYIFLYFFYDHKKKKSILIVDPQGSKFGDRYTQDGNLAIDEEAVYVISEAAKANKAKIYVSQDVIQQDGRSCWPISAELARIFYDISGSEDKKKELSRILSKSEKKQYKCYTLQYRVCTLGHSIVPKEIVDDFNRMAMYKFAGSSCDEEVGGQLIRRVHYDTAALIDYENIKKIKVGEQNYTGNVKKFLQKLGGTIDSDSLCPSFRSGIIIGTQLLSLEQVQQNRREKLKQEMPTKQTTAAPILRDCVRYSIVGAIVGATIAYLAGAAALMPLGAAVTVFVMSVIIGALVGYGVARFCETLNEKKEQNSDWTTESVPAFKCSKVGKPCYKSQLQIH